MDSSKLGATLFSTCGRRAEYTEGVKTVYCILNVLAEDEQSILFETSRPQRLFSEPTLLTWLYPQVTNSYFLLWKILSYDKSVKMHSQCCCPQLFKDVHIFGFFSLKYEHIRQNNGFMMGTFT